MGAGALALGESGSGMLDVSAGARVLSEGGWLSGCSGGFGTFLLSGQDTEWRAGSARWCWATAASAPWRWRRGQGDDAPRVAWQTAGRAGRGEHRRRGFRMDDGIAADRRGRKRHGHADDRRGRLTSGSIRVADVLLLPGTASDSTVTIRSGGMVGTGQLDAWDSARASVDIDGGILRLTRNQPGLFAGFRDGKVFLLGAGPRHAETHDVTLAIGLQGVGGLTKTWFGQADARRREQLRRQYQCLERHAGHRARRHAGRRRWQSGAGRGRAGIGNGHRSRREGTRAPTPSPWALPARAI